MSDPSRPAVLLVVAMGENGVIGRGDTVPWRLRSDLQHFRALTWGKPLIMGRKTFLTIKRPLPGRTSIVVSRDKSFQARGAVVTATLATAFAVARADAQRRGAAAIAVIGGAQIYAQTMPLADELILTLVHRQPEGDAVFPPIDPHLWREAERLERAPGPGDDAPFAFIRYRREETPIPGTPLMNARPAADP